ncbi:uncharacterized protein LOC119108339 [Pollicipes pollicipes]|uniref:uncharacterized protein LOC119108339 n=1 Tax=Pollicipes pollicipes TaxID=41117 RepID=UPI001884CFE9|nr:uncharacterized protein LOC119108339 [Pollicipes pollicipes]
MGADKKTKDKRKTDVKDQHKKAQERDTQSHAGDHKTKSVKQKNTGGKSQKGSWSGLAKLNMLLLLTVVGLAGRVVYMHAEGDLSEMGLQRARGRVLASWASLAALSRQHGGPALEQALQQLQHARQWAAERAARVDRYLMETQRPYWEPVKGAASRAAASVGHYGALAGERAVALIAVAARRGWEAAEAGWTVAAPHCRAALATAAPYWNAREGGPLLLEYVTAAQRTAADVWEVVQREAPKYAAKVGDWLAAGWQTS